MDDDEEDDDDHGDEEEEHDDDDYDDDDDDDDDDDGSDFEIFGIGWNWMINPKNDQSRTVDPKNTRTSSAT